MRHLRFRSKERHAMKTFISTRPALFAAALVITLSFGCGDATEGEVGSSTLALATAGECNAIVANSLRTAQQCQRISCEPGSDQCIEALDTLLEFVSTPGCLEAFGNEELNGLPGNASIQPAGPNLGAAKHISEVICGTVEDCGLCDAALSFEICVEGCTPIP
jgi:hypothetical protein